MNAQENRESLAKRIALMAGGAASDADILGIMDALQELAASDSDLACSFMADLYPVASNAYLHDVCDSITIWIVGHRSASVVSKLKLLSTNDPDPDMRKYWAGLLPSP